MDSRFSDAVAGLNSGRHEMRGMQIVSGDLDCLREGSKIKVPGTLMNVVAAFLQMHSEKDGAGDFAVFSTWLSPLVSRKVPQGTFYGTIAGHIQDACQGQEEMLLAKARWLFPLFGDNPPHWVLGWIDLSASEMHIFDSAPELQSYMWAEPALVEVGETVFTTLGKPVMDLAPWPVVNHSPSELHRQMNAWACGFFVIHCMRTIGNGESLSVVTNDQTANVKSETLDLVIKYLPLLRSQAAPELALSTANDVIMTEPDLLPTHIEIPVVPVASPVSMPTEIAPLVKTDEAHPYRRKLRKQISAVGSSKRKLDDETVINPQPPKKKRERLLNKDQREALLNANPNISTLREMLVWVKLHATREFKIENWTQHEGTCSAITGKILVRTAIKPKLVGPVATGSGSIASFFGAKPNRTGSTSKVSTTPAPGDDSDSESSKKVKYTSHLIPATPSVTTYFKPGPIKNPPPKPAVVKVAKSCVGLFGGKYKEYVERTETRSMGGVSMQLRGRIIRQVLLYKKFGPLKAEARTAEAMHRIEASVPANGNDCVASPDWTEAEHEIVDDALAGFARWEVNYGKRTVRSSRCGGLTTNEDEICDACRSVAKDLSLKSGEANLPLEKQHEIQLNREKYSSKRFHDLEGRKLDSLLKDPITFKALKTLEKGETTECFLQLYEATLNGKLKGYETVKELCTVVADVIKRTDAGTMSGIRYPPHYLNFAILMRSYGGSSARQFGILGSEIPLPSARHLRSLVAKSEDALTNPYLIFENMTRVKRLVDSIHYSGPVGVAGDCTKVRKRLAYSTDFGGHILGSVWNLARCIAEDPDDIKRVIEEITKAKAEASQVRAILIKVPLPHIPPQVVALLPTDGKDDAAKIVEQQLKLLAMAAELSLPVVCFSADGAASELAAQKLMDSQETPFTPITYDYPLYGIHLKAPVMKTGPVVSGQDAGHGKKTARNQAQHGTKTMSTGRDVVVNQSYADLHATGESGLLVSDFKNTDKQDDGPARHLFHIKALQACTIGEGDEAKIREGFGGLFVYLFVLGVLFDAWLNRTMTVANRVLAVLRARFFLHFWRAHIVHMSKKYPDLYSTARSFISAPSFHIFNRLCDSMLLLVIIYARRYPNQPFCPWLLGTEFVEHFFGLARMMLPNFTWAEFIKLVQHVMVWQRILLSGKFKEKRERNARVGYVLDFDASPLTPEDKKLAEVKMTDADMNALVEIGFVEAALICTQILHIPAPKPTAAKPLELAPLGVHAPKAKSSAEDSDSDEEDDFEDEDEDEESISEPFSGHSSSEDSRTIALAAHDAARYSALCEDYEDAVNELNSIPAVSIVAGPPPPPDVPVVTASTHSIPIQSELVDPATGKLSISMMLRARLHWQAGTTTRSEKVSEIDSTYALRRFTKAVGSQGDDTEPEKMTIQEGSNLVRVLQDQNVSLQESKPIKYRALRWRGIAATIQRLVDYTGQPAVLPNIIAKNVHQLNPLAVGSMTLMWSGKRFYIGQVMDLYKKGANSRYGSLPSSPSVSGLAFLSLRVYLPMTTGHDSDDDDHEGTDDAAAPLFSCYYNQTRIRLHTHARIDHLLFNLGPGIFDGVDSGRHWTLKPHAASCWKSLTKPGHVSTEVKKCLMTEQPTLTDSCIAPSFFLLLESVYSDDGIEDLAIATLGYAEGLFLIPKPEANHESTSSCPLLRFHLLLQHYSSTMVTYTEHTLKCLGIEILYTDSDGFVRLHEYAHSNNLRVILWNRRDYRGSTKYTNEELEDLREGRKVFQDRLAIQTASFLAHFIKHENTPKLTADRRSGGFILMGWSFGNATTLALLSDPAVIPDALYKTVEPYLMSFVLYDPPYTALGYVLPGQENFYNPWADPDYPTPEQMYDNFQHWVSSYYKHPDIASGEPSGISFEKRTEQRTVSQWTAEEKEKYFDKLAAVRTELPSYAPPMQGILKVQTHKALFDVPLVSSYFPKVNVLYLSGIGTCSNCIWAYMESSRLYKEALASGEKVRPTKFKLVEGGNHFLHYDLPDLLLREVVHGCKN
ncbi:hypothetical protein DFH09DRAFT_1445551 [Mycena vulgaris]|nr:hypothetical protein DFH09DRAFT_1445551 [Mycena vulgaris]